MRKVDKLYKGNYYLVIGIARHSETLENMVVYRQVHLEEFDQEAPTSLETTTLSEEYNLWVRPFSMFEEKVIHEGEEIERFRFIR